MSKSLVAISLVLMILAFSPVPGHSQSDEAPLIVRNTTYDYAEGLQKASEQGKPIFLLFTGNGCKNNMELQANIKEDPKILMLLEHEFINVWLYVDDSTPLPKEESIEKDGAHLRLKTLGHKWGHLEMSKFDKNYQPMAVIIDAKENILQQPMDYDQLRASLLEYLQDGLMAFHKTSK